MSQSLLMPQSMSDKRDERKRPDRNAKPKLIRLYEYFFSISVKKALESRTKSASVSLTSSPTLGFSTDPSGMSATQSRQSSANQEACRPGASPC